MRTSRPLKHAPIPLLKDNSANQSSKKGSKVKGKGKGRGKSTADEEEDSLINNEVYSYAPENRGRGIKQAARRLRGARESLSASNAESELRGRGSKGRKAKEGSDGEEGEDDDGDDEDDEFGQDVNDLRGINFKLGAGSDDDDDGLEGGAGFDSEDDEEIDSDLAGTDSEEESAEDDARPRSSKSAGVQQGKKKSRRQVAADFYSDQPLEIDLNEDSDASPRNAEDEELSEDGYMDLSEMLRDDESTSKPSSGAQGRSAPSSKASGGEDDLKQFGPGFMQQDGDDSEDDEEEDEESEDGAGSGSNSDDEDSLLSGSDIEEDDPEALSKLNSLIDGIAASSKRRRPDEAEADEYRSPFDQEETDIASKKRKKNLLRQERTEALPEGDFVVTGGGTANGGKVTLESMLSTLDPTQVAAIKKSLKPLQSTGSADQTDSAFEAELARLSATEAALLQKERKRKLESKSNNLLKAPGALPAPLAPLHQAKIERQAAKEAMNEEVKKWEDTVKHMRGISKEGADDPEHRLVLPLVSQNVPQGTSSSELVAKFAPSNDLERQISSLISSTGMSQSVLMATENSALMEALPPSSSNAQAHDAARVAQLRLARELMFRAERKAKRVSKIKSRTFRKIAKKAKARALANGEDGEGQLTYEEMEELDKIDGGTRAAEERERLEILRAQERATLRHASGKSSASAGGRWSKNLRNLSEMDDDMKDAIRQRESKQELLRRKILGKDDDLSDDGDANYHTNSDDESDDGQDVDAIKASAFDELATLKQKEADESSKVVPKGLMGMKFMQRAIAREDAKVDSMIDDFQLQVGGDGEGGSEDEEAMKNGDLVQNNPGRMVFAPSGKQPQTAALASTKPAASSAGEPNSKSKQRRKNKRAGFTSRTDGAVSTNGAAEGQRQASTSTAGLQSKKDESNPWLQGDADSSLKQSRKNNEQVVNKDSRMSEKATARLKKEQGRGKDAVKQAQADAAVEIDPDKVLLPTPAGNDPASPATSAATLTPATKRKRRKNRENAPPPSSSGALHSDGLNGQQYGHDDDDSDNDSSEEALPELLKRQQGPQAFKQRDLVARAFAGDNVVADFEEMKRAEIEADAPHEEDLTLPGWGSWGGKGVRKPKNAKKIVKHVPGVDASKRKDAKLNHVIITEKKDKKAAKYATKDLPYPYTSIAQYEQRLAQPTGVEWTTRGSFKEMTTPKVLIKPGAVIKPVDKQI